MKYNIIVLATFVAVLALPLSTFAATYGYITTSNCFQMEEAFSADQALLSPANIGLQSGVILLSTNSQASNFASQVCQ